MPGKERRTATKAGRLPPAEKNLAGHLKFMENGRRCQGKRVERGEGKGKKERRKGEERRKCARWLGGSCAPGLIVGGFLVGRWPAGAAWCMLR